MGTMIYTFSYSLKSRRKRKKKFAQSLRRHQTKAEKELGKILKTNFPKWRWEPQAIVLGWIVDWYCYKLRLAIEVDGSTHNGRQAYDARRAKIMKEKLNIETIRFQNHIALRYQQNVIATIKQAIENSFKTIHPKDYIQAPTLKGDYKGVLQIPCQGTTSQKQGKQTVIE